MWVGHGDNMGCDLYFLEERIEEENGALAQGTLSRIIDVLDDDQPFKEVRIQKLVDEYQNNKKEV